MGKYDGKKDLGIYDILYLYVDDMPGCHSCRHEKDFDTENEPCKSCYGLSKFIKKGDTEEEKNAN